MRHEFAFTPNGSLVLLLDTALAHALLELQNEYEESNEKLHRTPAEDVEADIFDRLEVEMANDRVLENATSNTSLNNVVVADQVRQQLTSSASYVVLQVTSPEVYNSYLMWFNSLYTYSRRDSLQDFTVGAGQDDSFDDESLPLLTRHIMSITSVLADVGINAARAIEELGENNQDD